MSFLRPKYITFDCYCTLTNFHMGTLTRELSRAAGQCLLQLPEDP